MESIGGNRCPCCTEPGTLKCMGCGNVKYCSPECQQADWPSHKLLCKSFKDFEKRPAPDMRRVVYFPPDGSKPEFKWARNIVHEEEGETWHSLDLKELLAGGHGDRHFTLMNSITGAELGYGLFFSFDDAFLEKYATVNRAVDRATLGRNRHEWKGPLVAYCGELLAPGDIAVMHDMDLLTYADLIAELLCCGYGQETAELQAIKALKGAKVPAVWVACNGEMRLRHTPKFRNVMVPATHPVFMPSKNTILGISEHIGMPLSFYKEMTPGDRHRGEYTKIDDYNNQVICFMHLCADPQAQFGSPPGVRGWGWAPEQWDRDIGNVLVARVDRKGLDARVLEAFGTFCWDHLQPLFEHSVGGYDPTTPKSKETVLAEITPSKWATYLADWMARH